MKIENPIILPIFSFCYNVLYLTRDHRRLPLPARNYDPLKRSSEELSGLMLYVVKLINKFLINLAHSG